MMPLSMFLTKIKKRDFLFDLLLLSIFLINFPPFDIFGFSKNLIAKFFIFFIFVILILTKSDYKVKESKKTTEKILILFFLFQSLSVIKTISLPNFWIKFQNLIFFIILFFIFNRLTNKNNINLLIKVILFSSFIDSFFEFLILHKSFTLTAFLKISEFSYIRRSYLKEKLDYPNFSYSLIPLVFYFIIKNKIEKKYKIVGSFLLILIFYNSLISNNRTFFLMMIFSLFFSLILYSKEIKRFSLKKTLLLFLLIVLIYFLKEIAVIARPFTFLTLNRLSLEEQYYSTVTSRVNIWKRAIEVGNENIFFGVGLGNFAYYLPYSIYIEDYLKESIYKLNLPPVYSSPHNMFLEFFAEGGIFGLLTLIFLFLYFFFVDTRFFFKNPNDLLKKSVIISFWSLFIFLFFNPINIIKFFLYFVIYRSLREI